MSQTYGSDLNQVWTNILDNAADVLDKPDLPASPATNLLITIRIRRDSAHLTLDSRPGQTCLTATLPLAGWSD